MTPRYTAIDNSFSAKEILKKHGFRWIPNDKKWIREEGIFDMNGHTAAESVREARREIKEAEIECNIVYSDGSFKPGIGH